MSTLDELDVSVTDTELPSNRHIKTPSDHAQFGVPLEEFMGYDGKKGDIPRMVKDHTQYLRDTGDIFRNTIV